MLYILYIRTRFLNPSYMGDALTGIVALAGNANH